MVDTPPFDRRLVLVVGSWMRARLALGAHTCTSINAHAYDYRVHNIDQ